MVVYDQQSIDMSLYAAAVLLANKGTTERAAVEAYNSSKKSESYIREAEYRLKCLGADFLN